MWELDLLLSAAGVGNGTLDQNAWRPAVLLAASGRNRLAVDQLLAFYQDIDTATHRDPDGTTTTSLYAQVFLNPTVTWVAPDPDMVSLPTAAPIGDPVLSDHLKAIQPALGVSASGRGHALRAHRQPLTLDNLSLIYRVNALAMASKIHVPDLLSVAGLLSPTAASPRRRWRRSRSPAATLAFLRRRQTSSSPASPSTRSPICSRRRPPPSPGWATTTQMTQANIASTLSAVQQAVLNLLSAGTTLASPITTATQTSITVASDVDSQHQTSMSPSAPRFCS